VKIFQFALLLQRVVRLETLDDIQEIVIHRIPLLLGKNTGGLLERLFAPLHVKPRIAVECDSMSSLITEVEAGHGVALASPIFKLLIGKRLVYRPLMGTTLTASVGIVRATKGDVTPAGEKFCEILRQTSRRSDK
jgi:DNA-binding transcriptional LysR family regulator